MVKETGIFATTEDIEQMRASAKEVRETPVIKVHGRWLPDDAAVSHSDRVDRLAVKYGLPAPGLIDGEVNHYGMDARGQFTTYVPDEP